jgi:2-isopropylmalate synthase
LAAWKDAGPDAVWDIPYLAVDPEDIGREYREVIRVNSQSGKGGVAYLLEREFGIELPKNLQREFGPEANIQVDKLGREVTAAELKEMFWKAYIDRKDPWELVHFHADGLEGVFNCRASMHFRGKDRQIVGEGNGPIAAFVHGLAQAGVPEFEVADFKQHALSSGTEASAIAYIAIKAGDKTVWGAGIDGNIELASIKAVVSAVNRAGL